MKMTKIEYDAGQARWDAFDFALALTYLNALHTGVWGFASFRWNQLPSRVQWDLNRWFRQERLGKVRPLRIGTKRRLRPG